MGVVVVVVGVVIIVCGGVVVVVGVRVAMVVLVWCRVRFLRRVVVWRVSTVSVGIACDCVGGVPCAVLVVVCGCSASAAVLWLRVRVVVYLGC